MKARFALALLPVAALACWSSVDANVALEEPIRVRQKDSAFAVPFVLGALPGTEAPDAGPAEAGVDDAGAPLPPTGLKVTTVDSQNNIVYPGQTGKKLAGHVTESARSIGLRFLDLGTGYWSFPVDIADPQTPGQLTWEATCDFARTVKPGIHNLRFVPFDANGTAGEQRDLKVCVPSPTDGLHACDDKKPTPAAMIELTWDTNVNLDLHVTTPAGKDVSPHAPSTSTTLDDGGIGVDPKMDGIIDRDSNANCIIDGIDRETLSWQSYPAPGNYQLRANLVDPCGQQTVRFTVTVWVAEGDGPDRKLVAKFKRSGELVAIDQNAADQTGLFLSDFIF